MYRKDKKISFLQSVQHKRQKAKRYKTKEKGFFGGSLSDHMRDGTDVGLDDEFYFPWEHTLQESIDLKSRHIFKNAGDELMNKNRDSQKAPPVLDNDFFLDAKSMSAHDSMSKKTFKEFHTKALRLGEDGEFLHFTKAISKQKLAPEEYHIPRHSQQRFMDPDGWRSNCNFIPIEPEKNKLRRLTENLGTSASEQHEHSRKAPRTHRFSKDDRSHSSHRSNSKKNKTSDNRFDIGADKLRKVVRKSARRMKVRHA